MKNKYIFITGGLIMAAIAFYFFKGVEKENVEIKTATVEKGNIIKEITSTGIVNPIITVQVGTQVSGTIAKIYVGYNDRVKKGQVIAEIDKTALLASVKDAESNVYRMKIQVDQKKRELDRNKELIASHSITQVEYDNSMYEYQTALANLNSAQSQLDKAKTNLDFATIVAPIDGVILSKSVDVGQTVAASFNTPTLFTIAQDLTQMQIEANVDEADIGQVKVGQNVRFTVDAYPEEKFEGSVKEIRLQPVNTDNVVTYTVVIGVNNQNSLLMPGMTANLSIITNERNQVLKVPNSALRFRPDQELLARFNKDMNKDVQHKDNKGPGANADKEKSFPKKDRERQSRVWVMKNGTLQPVKIQEGLSDGSFTEVTGAIAEGDTIVTGTASLKEGPAPSQQSNPFTPQMRRR
ncbi:MAG TPA: efflux RND transporter periplasmic adaptor subunit [Cytophagaceae bacterium]